MTILTLLWDAVDENKTSRFYLSTFRCFATYHYPIIQIVTQGACINNLPMKQLGSITIVVQ
jgi:hypothetical protein